MHGVLRVVPAQGETTWSFLHRIAARYGLEVGELHAWARWRWANPISQSRALRPDGEVLLNTAAQAQIAAWCQTPADHLARALPSWMAGLAAFDEQAGDGRGWARWRVGAREWGPVSFGCRLCTARRGGWPQRVWLYGPRWRRVCERHARWLLDVGDGHALEFLDVGGLGELAAAQARWPRVARRAGHAEVDPSVVFAVARAVVCGWWQQEGFWEREHVWRRRLERVAAQTIRAHPAVSGWPVTCWRLVARDAVVFPELVTVAASLVDPASRRLVVDGPGQRLLVRRPGQGGEFVAALGARLERRWLSEVEQPDGSGALQAWMSGLARERHSRSSPGQGHRGMWWVRVGHRPIEVGAGLRLLATAPPAGAQADGQSAGWQPELWVPRRAGQGGGLKAVTEQRFLEGLDHARIHAARHGHLAVAHARAPHEGFDLGRWLANLRATAACLPPEQTRLLAELDAWWNPPWPISWQRAWRRAQAHTLAQGPIRGGNNLKGLPRWLEQWLRRQISDYPQLATDQQQLLAQLGLTPAEVGHFHAWPARRRAAAHGLEAADAYAARHGHLAVSQPTTHDGFALGKWLNQQRHRQRTSAQPTRLGRQLTALDGWWDPPWPVSWQRAYRAALCHFGTLPHGMMWWPGALDAKQAQQWVREQSAARHDLHAGQQQLIDELDTLAARESVPSGHAVAEISEEA
ncbi:Helicase associated domain protein [Streptomyces sp. NBC_00658]|uniref:Helicase associated domain protein n=1 Tax=Streptomyces sp. NBC_00658 TaxID=2975800 RepID=UPI003251B06C